MPAHGLVAMEVQEDAQNGQGAQDDHPPVIHAQCECQQRQQGQRDHPIGHAAQCHDATRRRSGKPAPPVAVGLAGPVQEIEGHEWQELGQHELTLESPDHVVVLDPGKQPDRQESAKACPPAAGSFAPDEEEKDDNAGDQQIVGHEQEEPCTREPGLLHPEEDARQQDAVLVVLRPPCRPVAMTGIHVEPQRAIPHVAHGDGGVGLVSSHDGESQKDGHQGPCNKTWKGSQDGSGDSFVHGLWGRC